MRGSSRGGGFPAAAAGRLKARPSLLSEGSVMRPRKRLMPAGFAPCAVCDVSRHRRRELLAFHHSLSQPVKPLGARLSVERAAPFLGPNAKLLPGKKNGTAKEIIDQIKRELTTK